MSGGRFTTDAPDLTEEALTDIGLERERQTDKWGQQRHSDGTLPIPSRRENRERMRSLCDRKAETGSETWWDILQEEVAEAGAEDDIAMLRKELVQVAAVAVAWIEDIDSRPQFADIHDLGGEA